MKCDIRPMEFYVVVDVTKPPTKTAGGIIIPDAIQDKDQLASDTGKLVAVSPHAFTYAKWPEGARKPQVGDEVIFARYAGVLRKGKREGDPDFRIIHDKDVMAVIEAQPALTVAA